jgi:hypothetical protein
MLRVNTTTLRPTSEAPLGFASVATRTGPGVDVITLPIAVVGLRPSVCVGCWHTCNIPAMCP